MAEYIDREALIDAVESIDWYSVYKGKLTVGAPNTENALYKASSIYSAIDNAPAADVVPVRHGKWETNSDRPDSLICSVCKCGFDMWKHDPHNYCPNCGAKMDLE